MHPRTPHTPLRGSVRWTEGAGGGAAGPSAPWPSVASGPGGPGGPGAREAPRPAPAPSSRVGSAEEQVAASVNESYARKLRQFMSERAQERLQSQRRVAQLEEVLGTYGRRLTDLPAGVERVSPAGSPAKPIDGAFSHRLARLANERALEDARHQRELARLRATQYGLQDELDGGVALEAAESMPTGGAPEPPDPPPPPPPPPPPQELPAPAPPVEPRLGAVAERQRAQQEARISELQRHISVLQAGGVTSQLGRMRLSRLQDELSALRIAFNRGGGTGTAAGGRAPSRESSPARGRPLEPPKGGAHAPRSQPCGYALAHTHRALEPARHAGCRVARPWPHHDALSVDHSRPLHGSPQPTAHRCAGAAAAIAAATAATNRMTGILASPARAAHAGGPAAASSSRPPSATPLPEALGYHPSHPPGAPSSVADGGRETAQPTIQPRPASPKLGVAHHVADHVADRVASPPEARPTGHEVERGVVGPLTPSDKRAAEEERAAQVRRTPPFAGHPQPSLPSFANPPHSPRALLHPLQRASHGPQPPF